MARVCRECKELVAWNAAVCARCGEENPFGRNPGNLAILALLGISSAGFLAFTIKLLLASVATSGLRGLN